MRAATVLAVVGLACILVTPALPHDDGPGLGLLRIAGSHHVMPAVKAQIPAAALRPTLGPRVGPVPAVLPVFALALVLLARRRRRRALARPPLMVHAAHSRGVRGPPAHS